MTRRPLNVTIEQKIVYVHMAVWGLLFLFTCLYYFGLLVVWFRLVWVLSACFCTKQSNTKVRRRVCSLSFRYALGTREKAFGALTSKLHSAPVCWQLDEAIWLQVYVTDSRAHLASRIRTTFGMERELQLYGYGFPSPQVRLLSRWGRQEGTQPVKRWGLTLLSP